jgi:hypothetical protein
MSVKCSAPAPFPPASHTSLSPFAAPFLAYAVTQELGTQVHIAGWRPHYRCDALPEPAFSCYACPRIVPDKAGVAVPMRHLLWRFASSQAYRMPVTRTSFVPSSNSWASLETLDASRCAVVAIVAHPQKGRSVRRTSFS